MSQTVHGRRVVTISLIFFLIANFVWLGLPFGMAILWSLVDPDHPWSYPDLFPQVLSFNRWLLVWDKTSLSDALFNSYTIAPAVAVVSLLLSLPTAYAFGRMNFRGKAIAEMLTLIPLVMPGMIIGIFFSAMLMNLDISNPFFGIVLGHTVLTLPYSIRIMAAGFKSVPQDMVDASRDLGAGAWGTFCNAYLPMLKPSFLAALIFCLVKSLEEFSIAYVLGAPDFITVPTILYSFLGYSFVRPDAAVVSMILVIPNVILMIIIEKLLKGNYLSQSTGKA
ncbi:MULTISPECIES: ABC transporter permease [Escherichia]|uniref:ABC transporter permease n=1 Tax=Escherichia TaxID=561 RepID=UPI0003EF1553|nr:MULTISPECIES: ABC transporter permease [Escherichia]EEU9372014.1 ABC transporter permease [Escherichia coli]EEX0486864.1 ABC transporter permease [Escherichia coli]EFE7419210.1 ABC transporter permease [Escherichia coli]EFG2046361.1 ABC transporter permease [Escherichia coli]EFJ2439664.1 ABC transporter permease [Escherichia coli]